MTKMKSEDTENPLSNFVSKRDKALKDFAQKQDNIKGKPTKTQISSLDYDYLREMSNAFIQTYYKIYDIMIATDSYKRLKDSTPEIDTLPYLYMLQHQDIWQFLFDLSMKPPIKVPGKPAMYIDPFYLNDLVTLQLAKSDVSMEDFLVKYNTSKQSDITCLMKIQCELNFPPNESDNEMQKYKKKVQDVLNDIVNGKTVYDISNFEVNLVFNKPKYIYYRDKGTIQEIYQMFISSNFTHIKDPQDEENVSDRKIFLAEQRKGKLPFGFPPEFLTCDPLDLSQITIYYKIDGKKNIVTEISVSCRIDEKYIKVNLVKLVEKKNGYKLIYAYIKEKSTPTENNFKLLFYILGEWKKKKKPTSETIDKWNKSGGVVRLNSFFRHCVPVDNPPNFIYTSLEFNPQWNFIKEK